MQTSLMHKNLYRHSAENETSSTIWPHGYFTLGVEVVGKKSEAEIVVLI